MGEGTIPFWGRENIFAIPISTNNKDKVTKHRNQQTASSRALSLLVANSRDTDKDIHSGQMNNNLPPHQHPFLIHNS